MGDFRFVDTGWGNLLKRVSELASARAEVGVMGADAKRIHPHRAGSPHRVTLAEALAINEFGTGASALTYVPARKPLRRTFSARNPAVRQMGIRAAQVLAAAGTTAQVLGAMGQMGVAALHNTLAGDNPPSNAVRTIKRKGFDHPLLWTGMLWAAIAHRVVKRATKVKDDGVIEIGGF